MTLNNSRARQGASIGLGLRVVPANTRTDQGLSPRKRTGDELRSDKSQLFRLARNNKIKGLITLHFNVKKGLRGNYVCENAPLIMHSPEICFFEEHVPTA